MAAGHRRPDHGQRREPVPMLAMLKHLANVQEKEGRKVNLEYSNCCRSCWTPWPPNPARPLTVLGQAGVRVRDRGSRRRRRSAEAAEGDVVEAAAERPPRSLTATASRRPEPAAAVTVYVDDAVHPWRGQRWAHLMADTLAELQGGAARHPTAGLPEQGQRCPLRCHGRAARAGDRAWRTSDFPAHRARTGQGGDRQRPGAIPAIGSAAVYLL